MNPSLFSENLAALADYIAQWRQSPTEPANSSPTPAMPYLFLFLEIFAREGGIQSYVKDIFRSYSALDNPVSADVFLLRDQQGGDSFASDRLRFRYFKSDWPQLARLRLIWVLLLYLLSRRPRRVFCGHVNLAPIVWMFCKPLGISYTVMTHGKEVWSRLGWLPRLALQQADQIWTVSRYSRARAAASNQLDLSKIRLLACPVDGDYFTPGVKSPALVEQYGLAEANVIMTVARLWSGDIYKGVDVTIRALPQIAAVIPNVKYLVIGRGDDQPRLAKLAEELGVAERVVFAGFVPTEGLVEHYRLADAYIMPSQEGFGIVYIEAMACGIPVLAGDADGSADPLQDGELGWRVPHRDPEAVAQACVTILQEVAKRQRGEVYDRRCDGIWLQQQVVERFGKAAFIRQLQDLLQVH
jgi:glycosyltransferase involved in cell wall biosynthesis